MRTEERQDRRAWRKLVAPFLAFAFVLVFACATWSCDPRSSVAHPVFPDGGLVATGRPLTPAALKKMAGMYDVGARGNVLGATTVVYATSKSISLFTDSNSAYVIMQAACIENDTKVVLEGTWRFPDSEHTGLMRLFVGPSDAASALCKDQTPSAKLTLSGASGQEDAMPSDDTELTYNRALLPMGSRFAVVAHHGACQTVDACGISENSLESIRAAPSYGASIVEVDVQLSADGVPFLFHDGEFTPRLTQGPFCRGPTNGMSFASIRANCRLRFGEEIPSLEEALVAALAEPDLRGLWLDNKTTSVIAPEVALIKKHGGFTPDKARGVHFVVGLTSEQDEAEWMSLELTDGICLVETSATETLLAGCQIWGPAWTNGPSPADVANLQAQNKAAVFWTIDNEAFIDQYLTQSLLNGFDTDRPGLVIHRYQSIGRVPPDRSDL